MVTECSQALGNGSQAVREVFSNSALVRDDRGFQRRRRVVELQTHEALPRGRLEILEHCLVAWVV